MSMIADQHSRPCRRAGLCIAELIISIAIVAMLLTAVAAAFSASAQIIQENDQFFRATQAARVCMTQILTEVRRSQWVDDTSTSSTLRMITSNDQTCSYAYDATAGVVNLATEASYPLASNVSSCAFSLDVITDTGGIRHTTRVSVTLVVQVGNDTVRLSGSAAPRNEITYN
jgi:type II secretory pathway pseudopilin PulG